MSNKTLYVLWGATLAVGAVIAVPMAWRGADAPLSSGQVASESGMTAGVALATEILAEPIQPIPLTVQLDRAKVGLGRRLFHETRLSRNDSVSCASCHSLDLGGTDQREVSVGIDGALGDMNAPTVFNSGFNFKQFWDGRASSLEEQVDGPVHNLTGEYSDSAR